MRSYFIDEISPEDMERIARFLQEQAKPSGLRGLFWVEMAETLKSHARPGPDHGSPPVFAVELGESWIKLEFFVRDLSSMNSPANRYCTREERSFVLDFAHRMIEALNVKT